MSQIDTKCRKSTQNVATSTQNVANRHKMSQIDTKCRKVDGKCRKSTQSVTRRHKMSKIDIWEYLSHKKDLISQDCFKSWSP